MVENRLERILEDKAYVFTSCFAPMNCSAFGPVDDYACDPTDSSSSRVRGDIEAKQNEALLQMGVDVKRHVAKFVAPRDSSIMTDDDDDLALLTELEAHVHDLNLTGNVHESSREGPSTSIEFEIADSGSISELNTIGEQTWDDVENNFVRAADTMNSGRVLGNNINAINNRNHVTLRHLNGKHLTGVYKQSVRSKFEFYRKHQSFVVPPPRTTRNDKTVPAAKNEIVSTGLTSNSLERHNDRVSTQKPTYAHLKIESNDSDLAPVINSPHSRRNELARMILQRRQAVPL